MKKESETTANAARQQQARIGAAAVARLRERYAGEVETAGFSFAVIAALADLLQLPRPETPRSRQAAGGRRGRGAAKNPHRNRRECAGCTIISTNEEGGGAAKAS